MIREGRKTGYVLITAITESGWPSVYALKNLKRGDIISVVGCLTMTNNAYKHGCNSTYQDVGIRISKLEKIGENKKYKSAIQAKSSNYNTIIKSPGSQKNQSQSQSEKNLNQVNQKGESTSDDGILDDTEFNFED